MYEYIRGEYVHGPDIYLSEEYMDERWWHTDYPGYMISDCGRVWSEKTQRFIKPKPMDRHGHLGVCLHVDGQCIYKYLHRLMAEAFIPNPHNNPIVRHLNDIPDYNELDNLCWGTQKDNARDCRENGHAYYPTDADRRKGYEPRLKPVKAIDIETGEVHYFEGQSEASRILRIPQANIWKVLRGERRSAGGYYFEEVDKDEYNQFISGL